MGKHNVGFRTVRRALDTGSPPPRKTFIREPPQLGPLHQVIDALLQEELAARPGQRPQVKRIWEQLLDEHGATISYGTVRDYLAGRRPAAMR